MSILKKELPYLRTIFGVKRIGLFGSSAKGTQTEDADVDVLVEFEGSVGFAFIHLADSLEELLGIKVDLTTKDAIKPNRWKYIKDDLIYV